MIRTITERTVQNAFSTVEFPEIVEFAPKQIPNLRSKVIQGSSALVAAMKACLRYKRSYEHKKSRKALEETVTCSTDEVIKEMKVEISKPRPSLNILKGQLTAVRKKRVQRVKVSSAGEHLRDFPALSRPELVLWEFSQLSSIPIRLMESRLQDVLPKFSEYFKVEIENRASLSPDVLAVATVSRIFNTFGTGQKKNKKAAEKDKDQNQSGIFRVYKIMTLVADTVPKEKDHPCMVAIGDQTHADLHFVVYVDTLPIFAGNVLDALLMLIACYYVFDVSWPVSEKLALILLTASVIPENMQAEIKKYKAVFSALEAVKGL